jgi:hypothetical protein
MKLYDEALKEGKGGLLNQFLRIANEKDYKIYYSNSVYPININLWGVRSSDPDTKRYNDMIVMFYEEKNVNAAGFKVDNKYWVIKAYNATTHPSDQYLLKPLTKTGTLILPEGQHKSLWKIGYHKGKYEALVQANPVTVIRDYNKDDKLDINSGRTETGMFGLNCHCAGNIISDFIGLYSAGCQVFKNANSFHNEFMVYIKKGVKSSTVSYTLINQRDLML